MIQRQVGFVESIKMSILQNYCNFSGRSSRSEFWRSILFCYVLGNLVGKLFSDTVGMVVNGVVGLVLFLPSLGLAVRRLHDTNHSGWWMLISIVPFVGTIVLLIWFVGDSEHHPNKYGPEPNLV